jgi:hypothetical protein
MLRRVLITAVTAGCAGPLPEPVGTARGCVVLLRGLANIFSTGMSRLAERLGGAGYRVELSNHLEWGNVARRLTSAARDGSLPRPMAVIGHSLGADDAIRLAGEMGEAGVALDLLVTFDPVWVREVPRGPRRVVNFYLAEGLWGHALEAVPGFAGQLENVAVDALGLTHFDIEKDAELHTRVLATLARASELPPSVNGAGRS